MKSKLKKILIVVGAVFAILPQTVFAQVPSNRYSTFQECMSNNENKITICCAGNWANIQNTSECKAYESANSSYKACEGGGYGSDGRNESGKTQEDCCQETKSPLFCGYE